MDDEIIRADEVVVSPRGRKAEIDPELVAKFKALKPGEAIKLGAYFGSVPKAERSKVSQQMRKHWEIARKDGIRIDYTPEGVPQVRVKAK
jgi:hypothetical protein